VKKFRTPDEYAALTQALASELMSKPKEELAAQVALELVAKLMQEEFDHDHLPELEEARVAAKEAEARLSQLFEHNIIDLEKRSEELTRRLAAAPSELSRRGNAEANRRKQNLKRGKLWFLDQQKDTLDTEILARRLDRYFGTKKGSPGPADPASRGASDTVREWKKLRSACGAEERRGRRDPQGLRHRCKQAGGCRGPGGFARRADPLAG
jgi:hypothetical protein